MSELNVGMSKFRTVVRFLDKAVDLIKLAVDAHKEQEMLNAFADTVNPSRNGGVVELNDENTTWFSTEGMGAAQMSKILKSANIPHVAFQERGPNGAANGKTYIVVPNNQRFAEQATALFGQQKVMNQSHASPTRVSNSAPNAETQQLIQRISANKVKGLLPSSVATAPLADGNVAIYNVDSRYRGAFEKHLNDACIPFMSFDNAQTGRSFIIIDNMNAQRGDACMEAFQASRTELEYSVFIRNNLGCEMIQRAGITDAQLNAIRESLRGADAHGVQYAVRGSKDNRTICYLAEHQKHVDSAFMSATLLCRGPNAEHNAASLDYKNNECLAVHNAAQSGGTFCIADAQNPQNFFTLDRTGLRNQQGALIVGRQDPKFAATAAAMTRQMKAPVHGAVDRVPVDSVEKALTEEALAQARGKAAYENPEHAGVIAATIATQSFVNNPSVPTTPATAVAKAAADVYRTLADGIEEDGYRFSPEELKDVLHLDSSSDVEVQKFIDSVNGMEPCERIDFANDLRESANATDNRGALSTREISGDQLPIRNNDRDDLTMGDALDAQTQGMEFSAGDMDRGVTDMPLPGGGL